VQGLVHLAFPLEALLCYESKASSERPMSRLGQQDVGHEGVITGRDVLPHL